MPEFKDVMAALVGAGAGLAGFSLVFLGLIGPGTSHRSAWRGNGAILGAVLVFVTVLAGLMSSFFAIAWLVLGAAHVPVGNSALILWWASVFTFSTALVLFLLMCLVLAWVLFIVPIRDETRQRSGTL